MGHGIKKLLINGELKYIEQYWWIWEKGNIKEIMMKQS